jgi:hypothetical protein
MTNQTPLEPLDESKLMNALEWLLSNDTGLSSRYLLSIALGFIRPITTIPVVGNVVYIAP